MSQSEQLLKIANGVVNFCGEMRAYLEGTKENLDKVLNRHYQANHTPYAVMGFEDEAHYWEEQLANTINAEYFENPETMLPTGVELLRRRSYVIIRGNLKSGSTIRFDSTKFDQLYINGERYTGDYTFNGETPETYERLVVVAVQTPFNLGQRIHGDLDILLADFPIEHAEIYVNIGKFSELQPNIEELLIADTAESLYVNGSWVWMCRDTSFIKTLSVSETFSFHSESTKDLSSVNNYLIPNSKTVPYIDSKVILNVDMRNAGSIANSTFSATKIKGFLDLSNNGSIGTSTFESCKKLTSINIGNGITTIGITAFRYCENLKTAIIGDSVVSIGAEAFFNCPLRVLHLGKSILFAYNVAVFSSASGTFEEVTVSKGYHSPYTYFQNINIPVDSCLKIFKGILENCANVGEDGRTAATMLFKVKKDVFTKIDSASKYVGDDVQQLAEKEIALQILNMCTEKAITISQ